MVLCFVYLLPLHIISFFYESYERINCSACNACFDVIEVAACCSQLLCQQPFWLSFLVVYPGCQGSSRFCFNGNLTEPQVRPTTRRLATLFFCCNKSFDIAKRTYDENWQRKKCYQIRKQMKGEFLRCSVTDCIELFQFHNRNILGVELHNSKMVI